MAYLFLPSFNERCEDNGWCADAEIRRYLGKNTLRLVNSTVREDDIFLLLDADELPLPEVLLFLKLYNGYVKVKQLNCYIMFIKRNNLSDNYVNV